MQFSRSVNDDVGIRGDHSRICFDRHGKLGRTIVGILRQLEQPNRTLGQGGQLSSSQETVETEIGFAMGHVRVSFESGSTA